MHRRALILAAAAITVSGTAVSAKSRVVQRDQAALAQMIDGRAAGQPVSCIAAPDRDKLQIIDNVGVVYDAGKTIYVSRASQPQMLRWTDRATIDSLGAKLCAGDKIWMADRHTGATTGVLRLENFVPYAQTG